MANYSALKIFRDPLLSKTIIAAVIADGLLLLPFFFTSNLFSKILPSGNTSSLIALLVFSLVALRLSGTFDRLRTAGLLRIRRRMLEILAPQEGILLFARGKELTPNIRLLQSIMISLRSGDFVIIAGAALQVFFPIAVLALTLFVSFKLFLLILLFLLGYGYAYQFRAAQQFKGIGTDRIAGVRQSWFYRWMGSSPRRMKFYFSSPVSTFSPWTGLANAASMGTFRYSASLLLLALAAFLIIADSLPTGYLLPISFFSQRLLQPAERLQQVSIVYKIFTLAASNPSVKKSIVQEDSAKLIEDQSKRKVDSLQFFAPLEIKGSACVLKLAEPFEILSGSICVVSAGVGKGKTLLMESILGLNAIHTGRIDLKTPSPQPWDLIRYMNQADISDTKNTESFYQNRIKDIERILLGARGHLLIMDDPLMGMDARARGMVVDRIAHAKLEGATIVIASNDRQLVDISDHWLTISDDGQIILRKKDLAS